MAEKTYINGGAKGITFDNGGTIINCYIDLDDAKEKGLITKTQSGKNIIAFTLAERREPSQFGDTHYMYNKPYDKDKGGSAKTKVAKTKSAPSKDDSGEDELPF